MPRSRPGHDLARWLLAIGLAPALVGCGVGAGSAGPGGTPGTTPGATPLVTGLATPSTPPVAPTGDVAGPPPALLAAEGGDPVIGQLGTYTWGDAGSDSPWLPGAPIAVGAGEPLTVTLDGTAPIDSWTAIYVPARADGPAGGLTLGAGTGIPMFAAPAPGSWTVDLEVVFAADAGTAHYAWRLEVE